MAQASDTLFLWTIVAYAVAMLGYAAEFAFGLRAPGVTAAPIAGGATDTLPDEWVARRAAAGTGGRGWPRRAGQAAVAMTVIGWMLHAASLTTRGLAVDRVPWGNMYEFSSSVSLAAVTAYLVLLTRARVRYLGTFVMLAVVLYLGLAGTVLYAPATPLLPALNSYWIKIHVVGAAISSGVFMLAFVASALYLVKDRWPGVRLPAAATLDRTAYRVTAFAFPVWTFTVIAGAIWAEAAWGRYWGWDPKETWAFVTWVFYAGYLHARATAGWRGRRAAWIGVVGFVSLMITYYVVNLWISGLHSYSGL